MNVFQRKYRGNVWQAQHMCHLLRPLILSQKILKYDWFKIPLPGETYKEFDGEFTDAIQANTQRIRWI